MSETALQKELLSFLLPNANPDVHGIALQHLLPYTAANSPSRAIFDSPLPPSCQSASPSLYFCEPEI